MLTDYARNRIMDAAYREQALDYSGTRYAALFSTMPTAAGGGVEIGTADFTRVAIASSLANWSGTQGAGTTTASSGSSGIISNNVEIEFSEELTEAVAGAVGFGLFDAVSGGNLWDFGYIVDALGDPITRSWSPGDSLRFDPGTLVIEWV
jgi:hypothetical protein